MHSVTFERPGQWMSIATSSIMPMAGLMGMVVGRRHNHTRPCSAIRQRNGSNLRAGDVVAAELLKNDVRSDYIAGLGKSSN
jgi:hypothetical protein